MNDSIQQEIAAPKACKINPQLILIILVNSFVLSLAFTLVVLKNNGIINAKYLTAPLFIAIIVAIALSLAVLLRKQHLLMLNTLAFATIDAAALLLYHNAIVAKGSADMAWRMITISLSFAIVIFTLFFLGKYHDKPREYKRGTLNATQYLTYTAMFTALSVICKILGNAITAAIPFAGLSLKLTVVYIPWVLGGIVLGPIGGFAAAAIGDVIGQLAVSVGGMPLPGLTISNGLFAVFPALVFKLLSFKDTQIRTFLSILIGTVFSIIVCTLGISTFTLYSVVYSGDDVFFVYLFTQRVPQTIIIIINIALMLALSPALIKARIVKQPITFLFD